MKRLSLILLSVLMCAFLIVACEPQKPVDSIVEVKVEITNKDDLSNLYWRYTAQKTDSTGFTTGEKREETQFDTNNKLSLSTGEWKISLFGYEDDSYTNLLYKGELSTTVTKETTFINIPVLDEYIAIGKSGKYYKELKGTISEEITFNTEDCTFDLNGESLNIVGFVFPKSDKEYTIIFKNGTINGVGANAFTQYSNSHLVLYNVKVNWQSQGVNAVCFLYQGSNPVWLEVKNNSTLTNNVYGIGTNASEGTDYVYVTVDNSSVTTTSSDEDNTAILFNVPGELKISNSTISGQRQGVIVRGGNATISNSTIVSSGSSTKYNDYSNSKWGTGNEVPCAALVIGNRTDNSYRYPTTVSLDNVTLSSTDETRNLMYVYQNEGAPEVTVSGTLNGLYDAEAKENKRIFFNDASSIKSLGLFNLAANRINTAGKTVTITLGNENFKDINYSQTNSGYTGKGLLIGNTSLNWYAASPVTAEENKLTLILEGGSITSSSTGYSSIDGLGNTSVYMLLPNGNTDVIFTDVTFNNVISFDKQKYSSPWSNLNSLTLKDCIFDGIIVGTVPSENVTIDSCTFNNYTNTTSANNSNPIWWRVDGEGSGANFATIENFIFTNNIVSSTRPVKIERVGRRDNSKEYTPVFKFLNNTFDISSQSDDAETKNMAINIGQGENAAEVVNNIGRYIYLYDDGNKISSNTASLYTASRSGGSNWYKDVSGTKIMDRNGNEKTITALVWKTTTNETFEMKSIQ